ncbi:MAG: HAMP domain-containing sensor histidine kinase [Planctomycetota bacterium]|jgi:signal transduction histidine kinase
MKAGALPNAFSRLVRHALSVPIFLKVVGVVALVAVLFGGLTLLYIRESMTSILYQMLERRSRTVAYTLAQSLERPLSTGDTYAIRSKVRQAEAFPDVRYVVVRGQEGEVLAHTFERGVPQDLRMGASLSPPPNGELKVLDSSEGIVFNLDYPILGGRAGSLQLGVQEHMVARELSAMTHSMYRSLGASLVLGLLPALVLTYLLTRPIHRLTRAADRIREGLFDTRAEVLALDEIGNLAVSFNEMAGSLERYQREVVEKEKARLALLERLVHTQEEERKTISRELHDDLGQSLLAVMLAVESGCPYSTREESACAKTGLRLRQLVDDIHRLSWEMRPPILDDHGLESALARYVETAGRELGIAIDYQYSRAGDHERMPEPVEITLYRVVQEAVSNIVRHAEATRASVVVLQKKGECTLLVEDNGRGFETDGVRSDTCLGIVGMRERVAPLGGTCDIESRTGRGTTVRVRLPLGGTSRWPSES